MQPSQMTFLQLARAISHASESGVSYTLIVNDLQRYPVYQLVVSLTLSDRERSMPADARQVR